ncbi:MAG TPA: hypothetical protein VN752_08690 [Solirubrobacterales bacterium]|nr:hypothetical protein [Solirubrobacterales bacterium]
MTRFSAIVLLALFSLPSATVAKPGIGPQVAVTHAETRLGFWAGEAVPGTDWSVPETYWNRRDTHAYTPGLWRVLRHHRIPLYFGLRYRRDFGPVPKGMPQRTDGLRIIRRANRHRVPVWAWILVPYTEGYWAWEGAAAEHFDAVRAVLRWARAKRVRLRGLALDPEPPLRTPFEAQAAILSGGAGSSPFLHQAIDPAGQCHAWNGYTRIQRWAARHGVAIATAPSALALDDVADGRLALQDSAQFIVPDAPWEGVFFQAYRSVFAYYAGRDPGPGVVASYFRSSQREFGSAGQISLGSAGRGPYRRFSTLLHDVRLAATLGVRELPIYSLERTLRSYGGPRAVIRLVRAAQHPFAGPRATKASAPTPQATTFRAAIRRSDKGTTRATAVATASRGPAQHPNPWPDACRR